MKVNALPLEQTDTKVGCCPTPRNITRSTTHVVWYCPLSPMQLKKKKIISYSFCPSEEVQYHTEKILC